MIAFPLPYAIIVSDGRTMRTLQGPALGSHRAVIEAALADLLLAPASALAQAPAGSRGAVPRQSKPSPTMTQREIATASGYTGDSCATCGGFAMKRSGTCLSCDVCGSTSGGCS